MSRIIINKKMINYFLLKRSSVTLTFAFFPLFKKIRIIYLAINAS